MTSPGDLVASGVDAPRLSERRLRAVFDSIDEGYCLCEMILDEAGEPVDYRFLEVNPLFSEMTGLVDPVGRSALELVTGLEPEWVRTYARAGLGRESLRFQMGSDAMGRWFDVFAVPVEPHGHFAIVFKDQTDRHRAEVALRESEQRFRTMADQLPLLVWQHEADGRQNWVNERFCTFFGVQREDCGGVTWTDLLHPEDRAAYVSAFEAAVRERGPFRQETRVRRSDGAWRWVESWANPRFGADGAYLGHLGTSADVTERHAAETALRASAALNAYRAGLVDTLRTIADPVEVQAQAARLLGEHLGADRVHYAEVDPTGEYGVVHADHHPRTTSVVGRHRFDDYGPAVMGLFRAGQTVVVHDVAADPRIGPGQRAATAALEVGAYVVEPLLKDGRPSAVLAVHHRGPHRWTDDELTAVRVTAEHTWAAVERARAEHALRVRQVRAELVAELLSDLEERTTVDAQLGRLAELLVPRFADHAAVELPRRPARPGGADVDDPAGSTPAGTLRVPLDLGGGVLADLVVGVTDPRRPPYGPEDLAFLRETAQRVGVVVAAARLRQEEHDISVRLQQALLPDELIWHPNAVVEARYQAANALLDVGGDWYDTFSWPDGRIGVMVGDVVGHNLDSAAAMGRLRAATAALAAHTASSPAALLDALEQFARGPNGTEFATAVCVVVDPSTGRLAYSSAGHPPVLVLPPGGTPIRLEGAQSVPLCALATGPRPEAVVTLEPGSLVVLYSDGLIERRGRTLEEGLGRLEDLCAALVDEPVEVIADRLTAETAAESLPDDDVVVACFRYTPVFARFARTLPADGARLAGLRAEAREWLAANGLHGRDQHHVLLGIGEACANAIEHAYPALPGSAKGAIEVELTHHGHHVTAVVRDRGTWRPVAQQHRDGGRGTHIMRSVARHFARQAGTEGTTVTLAFPVVRREAAR